MNLSSITTSPWRFMVPIGIAFVAVLVLVRPPRLRALVDRVPELRAALVGFAVLLVLGDAFNDSGIIVPGMMFAVLCPTLALLVLARGTNTAEAAAPPAAYPEPVAVVR
jgi:hypothetical protein